MYYLLSLLSGILVSVMVAFNGGLTEQYGVYSAVVIIHIAGLLFITIIILGKREHPFSGLAMGQAAARLPWFLYLGGAIGVMTTAFNNLAFSRISVSSILALGLLGQSLAGLVVDQYGLMGMPKHAFKKSKIFGLLLILCGIISMTNNFDIFAVVISFIAGVNIVITRTLNAKLSERTSIRISTFYNYLVGLLVAVPVCFLSGRNEAAFSGFVVSSKVYIYWGGLFGVCIVLLNNIMVTKIPALYLSLFSFIGQIFSGTLIDMVISKAFSPLIIIGGIFVAAGLCVNLLLDRKKP